MATIVSCVCCAGCAEQKDAPAKSTPAKPTAKSGPLFNPTNPNHVRIEAAIRGQLEKPSGDLTQADLDQVTALNLDNRWLTDVSVLAALTNLEVLSLKSNELTDVRALAGLAHLKKIDLSANELKSLDGLTELTQLEELYLKENKLTNLSARI